MNINIVTYDDSYAAKVADMWNHSRDGWGGANTVDTEETILHRERNSSNILTYLALEDEKVVGYCGLSEYRDDEGALYIPLLNVRDDYHGKGIGKKLLLTALQKTIDLQWPRLDLYTWPGNTKAVPLYKKCGFFWEERDDSTHLMNFIPTVLDTEAVKDFFQDTDWYKASTRTIEVKPDGRIENDFHYYEYTWENDDEYLRIEFERTGRGIRLIETNDYLISATVENRDLVFGNSYSIRYSIINKTGNPLHIKLEGIHDKNIHFDFTGSLEVKDVEEITGTFNVEPIEEEQNPARTHPTVQTQLHINGKEALFKIGVLPKFPTQVTTHFPDDVTFIGKESVFYLDLVNNFREKVQLDITFPSSPLLELKKENVSCRIGPKEKTSIPIPFSAKAHGYYDAALTIKAKQETGEEVTFTKKIGVPLRGFGSKFHGEDDERIELYNGPYFVTLSKEENVIRTGRKKSDDGIFILTPKIGKPYSEELSRTKPKEKSYFNGDGFIGTKISYELSTFPSIKIHFILKLFGEGFVEHYYEVENKLDVPTEQPIWINQPILLGLEKAYLPYDGEIIEMNNSIGNYYEFWDESKVTENWMFVKEPFPLGVCWNSEDTIHFDSWYSYLEHNVGQIDPSSIIKTNPVYLSIGAFHDMESFRQFALQKAHINEKKTVNHITVSLQNNNPFVHGEHATIHVKDYKSNYLHGEVELSLNGQVKVENFNREEQLSEWSVEVPMEKHPLVSTATLTSRLDASVEERHALIIQQSNQEVVEKIEEDLGLETWTVDNGIIQFKATPSFYPTLHSLTYQGQEWLDSSFPTIGPRLWWNPWPGGISSRFVGIRTHSVAKEKTTAEFTSLIDNKGNKWTGIKLSTFIEKHEQFKGFIQHQYFLTLPGSPVLCHVTNIEQQTGTYFHNKEWQTAAFFKSAENIQDNWVKFQNKSGDWTTLTAGKDENDFSVERNIIIGNNQSNDKLQIIANSVPTNKESYINKELIFTAIGEQLSLASGISHFTTPNFYLFTDTAIPDTAQFDIQGIEFK
ncbi:GNAT family N-acetyltransferase [Ornithinibacillus halotolerans]|uniref:N-acetyltransferase domain-containing protein n=1 Tax=Ornithinibacillus halotolerans TaxID=1274357 RepID=A0A916W752_9BACI|nr:GNAT family N-acetyltransferase [Ornithinibacillus halotolerans]GGA72146.1 hypothetical protein GCM10008025_14960 [Ornithinibacillus halotolerans]